MKELIDRVLQLPKGQKIGLLIGLLLVMGAFYQMFLYSPRAVRISRLKEEIESGRNERTRKRILTANLPKLKQESQQLEGMLREAVSQLPDKKEIPELLSSISSKASEAGLQILTFRPLTSGADLPPQRRDREWPKRADEEKNSHSQLTETQAREPTARRYAEGSGVSASRQEGDP